MERILLLLICFAMLSCSKKESEVHTDVAGLANYINLPVTPVSVQWAYWNSGDGNFIILGPTDYSVKAVLKLNEDDFKKLKKQYTKKEYNEAQLSKDFIEDWFPSSIKDCAIDHGTYVTIPIWNDPKDFAQSPLIHGFLFFTNNNEVFVEMYTM